MAEDKTVSASPAFLQFWTKANSYIVVVALTVACLLPFASRAFHVDDPLFVWTARQIQKAPADPYGFDLIWDYTRVRMADVTQNPPLSSYYLAAVGSLAGWSERTLHLGFLLITVLLAVGVYRLAERFTEHPLVAAMATLLTPGLLVSASSVMCDTMMLMLWVWAVVFWVEGLEPERPGRLMLAGVLMGAAFLTKYFAAALILLVFVYSLVRVRRFGRWAVYLLIPLGTIWAYQHWTAVMYGQGLVTRAATYAAGMRAFLSSSITARGLMALSFAGGCASAPLWFAPLIWRRRNVLMGIAVSALAAAAVFAGWVRLVKMVGGPGELSVWRQHGLLLGGQLTLFLAGGLAVLSLVVGDVWASWDRAEPTRGSARKKREQEKNARDKVADSLLLAGWVLGTLVFAGFVNWSVNARSVLPLIPAAAILLTRQCERRFDLNTSKAMGVVGLALAASGAISLWIGTADAALANTARQTAMLVHQRTEGEGAAVWFGGRWGFQYYMEQWGAQPLDLKHPQAKAGDVVVVPLNNIWTAETPEYPVSSEQRIFLPMHMGATTIGWPLGAGFYSNYWGPMPYAIGPVPMEGASIVRIAEAKPAVR
jgi:4-amino-4-deoxy-L-arabinose transferase-like glycosyltransferase